VEMWKIIDNNKIKLFSNSIIYLLKRARIDSHDSNPCEHPSSDVLKVKLHAAP